MHEPTDDEQHALELLNRARANPATAPDWLVGDGDVARAIDFFDVDTEALRVDFAARAPAPPPAWSSALSAAAARHTGAMISLTCGPIGFPAARPYPSV